MGSRSPNPIFAQCPPRIYSRVGHLVQTVICLGVWEKSQLPTILTHEFSVSEVPGAVVVEGTFGKRCHSSESLQASRRSGQFAAA